MENGIDLTSTKEVLQPPLKNLHFPFGSGTTKIDKTKQRPRSATPWPAILWICYSRASGTYQKQLISNVKHIIYWATDSSAITLESYNRAVAIGFAFGKGLSIFKHLFGITILFSA